MKQYALPFLCYVFLGPLALGSLLCACSSLNSSDGRHKAICNQLKSDIVFNGATSVTRQAEIEGAEQPLQQHNYDANNCE